MKLVVDTNIIIAALLKQSTARALVSNSELELLAPDFLLEELQANKRELLLKKGISSEHFEFFFSGIQKFVSIIPSKYYAHKIPEALSALSDAKDAPFLALAWSFKDDGEKISIWSEDEHFQKQDLVPVLKTWQVREMILK